MRTTLRSLALRRLGWLGAVALVVVSPNRPFRAQSLPADPLPETIAFNRDIRPIWLFS